MSEQFVASVCVLAARSIAALEWCRTMRILSRWISTEKTHLSQQYTMWKHEQHTNKLSIWIYRTEVIIFPYHGTRRIWVWARNAPLGPGAPTDGPWGHCASDCSPVHPKAIEIERQSVRLSHSILLYRHCWKHSIQTNDWIWQSRSRTQIKHHANKQTEGVNKNEWKQQ